MSSLLFRTVAPAISLVMVLFSLIVLLRGHNDPGGGFIGGLLAASAAAVYGMALGPEAARKLLRINPLALAGLGIVVAIFAGLLSAFAGAPFLTGLWLPGYLFGTPGLFDVGVYLVVFGTLAAITLALEDSGEGE